MYFYQLYSLYIKELKRFLKVYHQTIISPIIGGIIFLIVLVISSDNKSSVNGINYLDFASYGIIIMLMLQNSFSNASSTMVVSKVIGYISDILMPPLRPSQIIVSYCAAGITRSVIIGSLTAASLSFFIKLQLYHPFLMVIVIILGNSFTSMVGILVGIFANNFEQQSCITNYLINPLSFVSGTFFSISKLPMFFQKINLINPFYLIISSFRYCITNIEETSIFYALITLFIINIILYIFIAVAFTHGWKIKS